VLVLLGVVVLLAAGGAAFLRFARPRLRAPSDEVVARTPERLQRGTYLVEHLLPCRHCHSFGDIERFGAPLSDGEAWAGGIVLDRSFGLPGVIQAPNISPDPEYGIGAWSDGEVLRAIREGVARDGHPLFPMMPYPSYREMSDEDVRSVLVYLRAAKPVHRGTKPIEVDFPVSLFIRAAPAPVEKPVAAPDPKNAVAYGGYLVKIAGCADCHTPLGPHGPDEKMAFAGGREFAIPYPEGRYRAVTANITPDPSGYFGHATKQEWIDRVRSFAGMEKDPPKVAHGLNTLMPWIEFSGLTDEDLGAIYDFLQTVPPIHNEVKTFPDAPAQVAGG
jgi:mono/diheme cytochrome c family protein